MPPIFRYIIPRFVLYQMQAYFTGLIKNIHVVYTSQGRRTSVPPRGNFIYLSPIYIYSKIGIVIGSWACILPWTCGPETTHVPDPLENIARSG